MKADDLILVLAVLLATVVLAITGLVLRGLRTSSWQLVLRNVASYLGMTVLMTIVLVSGFVLIAMMGPLLIAGWILLFVVSVEAWRKHRATRQYGLLWLLTVSAERSMPLAPAVEAFATESGGIYGRHAQAAAAMLARACPWPKSLSACPGWCRCSRCR